MITPAEKFLAIRNIVEANEFVLIYSDGARGIQYSHDETFEAREWAFEMIEQFLVNDQA